LTRAELGLTRTSALLRAILDGSAGESMLSVERLLDSLQQRAFGVFLVVVTLPGFLPIPPGMGALVSPILILLGLQMLAGFERPWLPARARRLLIHRASLERLVRRIEAWLERIEGFCSPCWPQLFGRAGEALSGLLVVLLALALSLPIPFTNAVFAGSLVLLAMAWIERDGRLLLGVWILAGSVLGGLAWVGRTALVSAGSWWSS
jgi:hypothetical protein